MLSLGRQRRHGDEASCDTNHRQYLCAIHFYSPYIQKGVMSADEQLRCKMKTLCAGVPAVTRQSGNRRTVCLDAVLSRQVKNQEKAGRLIGVKLMKHERQDVF